MTDAELITEAIKIIWNFRNTQGKMDVSATAKHDVTKIIQALLRAKKLIEKEENGQRHQ